MTLELAQQRLLLLAAAAARQRRCIVGDAQSAHKVVERRAERLVAKLGRRQRAQRAQPPPLVDVVVVAHRNTAQQAHVLALDAVAADQRLGEQQTRQREPARGVDVCVTDDGDERVADDERRAQSAKDRVALARVVRASQRRQRVRRCQLDDDDDDKRVSYDEQTSLSTS